MPLLGPRWAGPALGVPGAMTCEKWNAGMQCATAGMCGLQMSPPSLDSSSLQCEMARYRQAAEQSHAASFPELVSIKLLECMLEKT